jgi:alpha-1,2-mannosyltransferase
MNWKNRIAAFSNDVRAQRSALGLVAVALVVLLVQAYGKAYREGGYDLTSYLLSAKALLQGGNPYQTGSPFVYFYPLTFAFMMIPLALLPYWAANFLWFAINALALILSVKYSIELSSDWLGVTWGRSLIIPLTLLFLLVLTPIQHHFLNGQVDFVVLFLCVLFLKYFLRGRSVLSSLFLALAIAIKVVPGIFLLFLIMRKNYRAALLTMTGMGLLCLLPYVLTGPALVDFYREYARTFLFRQLQTPESTSQSFLCFNVYAVLSHYLPMVAEHWWFRVTAYALVLIPLLGAEALASKADDRGYGPWIFSLYLLAILLLSPMSETHHLAFLLPATALVILKFWFGQEPRSVVRVGFLVLFFAGVFLGEITLSPTYFLSICILFALTLSVILGRAKPAL